MYAAIISIDASRARIATKKPYFLFVLGTHFKCATMSRANIANKQISVLSEAINERNISDPGSLILLKEKFYKEEVPPKSVIEISNLFLSLTKLCDQNQLYFEFLQYVYRSKSLNILIVLR